jgi:FeS assembly SUF system protein
VNTQRIWPPDDTPPSAGSDKPDLSADAGKLSLDERIINILRQVYDPEIPVNIVDLGLIYKIKTAPGDIDPAATSVHVTMTLTTPNCPEAEALPMRVQQMIQKLPDVGQVEVDLVWDPPWDQTKMSEDARMILGLA